MGGLNIASNGAKNSTKEEIVIDEWYGEKIENWNTTLLVYYCTTTVY
jgi:hypothetical protein